MTEPVKPVPKRGLLFAAVGIAAVWICLLLMIVVLTANPVTINKLQVQRAEYVVEAKVLALNPGEVEIVAQWRGSVSNKQILLRNLSQTAVQVGETYIMPLNSIKRAGDAAGNVFEITPSGLPNSATEEKGGMPLVYPVNEESRKLVRDILETLPPGR
ncbi:MAG: hypothetical protein KDA69_21395 [Planctomycetaceae bacterium]|nr:hypothetical protein [Planctomycetaceae bacterium]